MLFLLCFISLLSIGIALFINLNPAFGENLTKDQKELFEHFDNYSSGKFVNMTKTNLELGISDFSSIMKKSLKDKNIRKPVGQIPVSMIDWQKIKSEKDSVTWLGHSAFLLSIDNKKILVDPMLGSIASPVSFVGIKRYKFSENIMNISDEMPHIDAVLITHDHYDHLDYKSIKKINCKVSHFFVPLGVGAHLIRWGTPKEKITELNWWDKTEFQGLTVVLTPSKHFSGRGLLNRNATLWGGFVVLGENTRLYTSGDGGYDAHFKEVGKKYGPFDITLIEGAQYDNSWSWAHMVPEQAVQAHLDVKGRNMFLMHWGAFTLAYHGWKEPIERALKEARKSNINLITTKIGETALLDSELNMYDSSWWDF